MGGKARSRVQKPVGAIAREVVPSGKMIVVQDSDPGREVKMRVKNGGERVPKMEDTKVLTDVYIAT